MQAEKHFIQEMIETLYHISEPCEAGVQRRSFTTAYRQGVDFVKEVMKKEGLLVREDAVGNLFGSLNTETSLPTICTGSHLDTVKCAGGFDGIAGVVCGIEAARMIIKSGIPLKHPFTVFGTVEEEGTRFDQVVLGSKFMTGVFGEKQLDTLKDSENGDSLREILIQYGSLKHGERFDPIIPQQSVKAVIELHGEQGPVLENSSCDIGIVDTIAGITWIEVTVTGMAGHSGTVPMQLRQDAGVRAYRMIVELHDYVTAHYSGKATLTVGKLSLDPGSSNCIPGKCTFTLDIRSGKREIMDDIIERVYSFEESSNKEEKELDIRILSNRDPVMMHGEIQKMLEQSCKRRGYSFLHLDSGAGHDSMVFARRWPAAMLFLPNKNGISHHPDEYIDWEDLKKGAEILYDTIRFLDSE